MPSKKKKYNARFPAGRIKKIMQSDEEVGKVAQAVPVIISRTLELFVESLLTKTLKITNSRNAKTLSPSHMKQCIMAENRFDFLRELVKNIPDISVSEEIGQDGNVSLPGTPIIESPPQQEPYDLSKPSTSCEINFPITFSSNSSTNGNSVIRNGNNTNSGNRINITTTTTQSSSNNSIIGTNMPLPAHSATRNSTTTLGGLSITQSILPSSREELMRQWDSVSQIRQQMLSTIQTTKTTTTTVPLQQNTTITTTATMDFYNTNNNTNRKTTDCSPPKLRRMDSLPITTTTDKTTNITINLDKKNRKLQHQPKSLPPTTDLLLLQKYDNKLPPVPAPIINIDICNKPIIKIDYSNLNLHDNNNDYPTTTSTSNNDNKKNNTSNFINSNISNLTTQQSSYSNTNNDLIKKNSPVSTFNPIINIDLSKIATQPPTIHFNLGNINSSTSSSSSSNSSSTKIDTKINTSVIRSSSLDLDEDYDNI